MLVDLNALLGEDPARGRRHIDGHIARGHFKQAVSFDHSLARLGVPGGSRYGHARQIKIG
jgi:hypothetical protein